MGNEVVSWLLTCLYEPRANSAALRVGWPAWEAGNELNRECWGPWRKPRRVSGLQVVCLTEVVTAL